MTEIPEHLLKRSQEAKAKADGEGFPTEKLGLLLALFIALGLIYLAAPKPE